MCETQGKRVNEGGDSPRREMREISRNWKSTSKPKHPSPKYPTKHTHRDRETQKETERERQGGIDRDTERKRETDRQTQRRETDTEERKTDTEERERQTDTEEREKDRNLKSLKDWVTSCLSDDSPHSIVNYR